MAAWGKGPLENELATDYIRTMVEVHIKPVLLEQVPSDLFMKNQHLNITPEDRMLAKHKLAWYYDRLRAAISLMEMLEKK